MFGEERWESPHPSLFSILCHKSQELEFSKALGVWKIQNHFSVVCKTPKCVPWGLASCPFITFLLEVLAETGERLLPSLFCGPIAVWREGLKELGHFSFFFGSAKFYLFIYL